MGESFSCQTFPTTWSSAKWLKGKGAWELQGKTKAEINLEKGFAFPFWGLGGFWGVCVNASVGCCLVIAWFPRLWKTLTQCGPVSLNDRWCTRISCVSQRKRQGYFYFKMISVNAKDSNCFHKSCLKVERIYMEWGCFVISRLIPNPAGKWWNFIHFIYLEGRSQLHWLSIRY